MGRENKKEVVAALHREQIMKAAEKLFSEKGYVQTTIDDISKASEYSRRTIYAYYENKDDILHHIIEKGLQTLKVDIENAVNREDDFVGRYKAICMAMSKYQREYPHSVYNVNSADFSDYDFSLYYYGIKLQIIPILFYYIARGKYFKDNSFFDNIKLPLILVYISAILLYVIAALVI